MAMDPEEELSGQQQTPRGGALRRTLLLLSIALMFVGGAAGPVFTRIYFLHGGARLWLTSLLQTCGFPILFLPLSISYLRGLRGPAAFFSMTAPAAAACAAIGVVSGLGAYMYAYGSGSLPASTSSLLGASQLAFTAGFAFLIVRQRFTAYSVNAVALLVMGPVILALQSSGDHPAGESDRRYYVGFFLMLGAAALMGLLTPVIELTCRRMKRQVTHLLVLEMQLVLAASATAFCAAAMLVNRDFQAISREAEEYGLGKTKYYLVLAACAIAWQLSNVGLIGVISFGSSLLAGVVMAMLLPLGAVLPVLVLHEKFTSGKGVAMVLSIWGFVSYLYGEYQQHKQQKQPADEGALQPLTAP